MRYAMEEFEMLIAMENVNKMEYRLKMKKGGKAPSNREARWDVILRTNVNNIVAYLIDENRALNDEEIKRWVSVAQNLYAVASKHIHNYSTDKVRINSVWLSADATKLACSICEALPVKYTIIEGGEIEVE